MNKDKIAEIKASADVATLAAEAGVKLKNGRGTCLFCGCDAALMVKVDHFHCFKCGAQGDAIEFVTQTQGTTFIESVKFLAGRAGISTETNLTKINGENAAKEYLKQERHLDVPPAWYSQEATSWGNNHSATVRFKVADDCSWERIIDSHKFGGKARFVKGSICKGESWTPPGQRIGKNDTIYITEGIFDAIALRQALGVKVAAAMSSSSFPAKLIEKHSGKNIHWRIAGDYGSAGSAACKKWSAKIREMRERVSVLYPPGDDDYNDYLKRNELTNELIQSFFWRGQNLVARSAGERMALLVVKSMLAGSFLNSKRVIEFSNCYFSCEFKDKMDDKQQELQMSAALADADVSAAVKILMPKISAMRISTATAKLLYTQIDSVDETHSYYFNIKMHAVRDCQKVLFKSNDIEDARAFNSALLKRVSQSMFMGGKTEMAQVSLDWFAQRKPTVQTIRHMGYSPKHQAYVFPEFGFKNGNICKVNEYDYLKFGNMALKTTFKGWQIPAAAAKKADWFNDYFLASGNNGLTALIFWLTSLFAAQIRAHKNQTNIPFLEYSGVSHSGKTETIGFLWKLIGRAGHEGEDFEKMTPTAIGRSLMQASNIPAVMLEGDRDTSAGHRKKFDFNFIKTLFAGQSPMGRGIMNNGIDIDNDPFLGTLVISQNIKVEGEPQLLNRMVSCSVNRLHFTQTGFAASNRLKRLNSEEVVHFMYAALGAEAQIMKTYAEWYDKYTDYLLKKEGIYDSRIAENHAQIMAFGKCLQIIVPEFTAAMLKDWLASMVDGAQKRQIVCQSEANIITRFWEIYDAFNRKVGADDKDSTLVEHQVINHNSDENIISINMPLFQKMAAENKQVIDIESVKRLLPTSKTHKFKDKSNVRSNITGNSLYCWNFAK